MDRARVPSGRRSHGELERWALAVFLLTSSPALAAPPYRTDDPEPTDYQHYEWYNHATGTHISDGAGGLAPAIELDYGILPQTQLSVVAPMAFSRNLGTPLQWGYGDMQVGVKYRLIEQSRDDWTPSVAVFPTVQIATGDASRALGTGATRSLLPLWLQKDFGDWSITGGGGYWFNRGAGNRDFWFAGLLLQRKIADNLKIGAEIFHQSADTAEGKDSTGFNIGAIYDFSDRYHLVASAGRGFQNARATNAFSWYLGFEVTGGGEDESSQKKTVDASSSPFGWEGFYAGAGLAHIWRDAGEAAAAGQFGPVVSSFSAKGPAGGPLVGFDWRAGGLVLGLETEVEASSLGGSGNLLSWREDFRGSARGRLGVATDRALFYATGGGAAADIFSSALGESFSRARLGWTAGGGLELAIGGNWTGRIEYRYSDFGSASHVSSVFDGAAYRESARDSALRMSVAYYFEPSSGETRTERASASP